LTCLGVAVGFHRYFTHGAFKATRGLRIALAVVGSMAMQGLVIGWVADHRRHHAYADKEGDPHSPWLFGTSAAALARGFWHAHMGWMFNREQTNAQRFTPELLANNDIRRVDALFPILTVLTLLAPAVLGGLITLSLWGALTALFWASLVRVALLHHVTWSVNSICHMIGDRSFDARDKSANFWPLAIASMGESWHNSHHADPTCARHGVQKRTDRHLRPHHLGPRKARLGHPRPQTQDSQNGCGGLSATPPSGAAPRVRVKPGRPATGQVDAHGGPDHGTCPPNYQHC
jgi:stearoyl-CoA desaturase (delta-9 desaturase)